MLNRPRRSGPAVTNGSERLPSPLLIGLVERILFSAPVIELLYSATTKTKPSYRASVFCQRNASAFSLGVDIGGPFSSKKGIGWSRRSTSSASMSLRAWVCFSIQPAALSAYRPGRVEPITMAMRGLVVTITTYFFRQVAAALRKASCSNEKK